jgi:hypothetical protein
LASLEGNNLLELSYISVSETWPDKRVVFGVTDLIRGWPLVSDLIRGVAFGEGDLIRDVAFGEGDLIRGVAFGESELIRGAAFGESDLRRGWSLVRVTL